MRNPDNHPGTLPCYLPVKKAVEFSGMPIDASRLLTMMEEGDMLAANLKREQIIGMTPETLESHADMAIEHSELFIGA